MRGEIGVAPEGIVPHRAVEEREAEPFAAQAGGRGGRIERGVVLPHIAPL
jgi:hypothetical protein